MVFTAGAACGQDFPAKPIRIVTSAPGGGSDFTSRLIASGLTEALGPAGKADIVRWGKVIKDAGIRLE